MRTVLLTDSSVGGTTTPELAIETAAFSTICQIFKRKSKKQSLYSFRVPGLMMKLENWSELRQHQTGGVVVSSVD